MLRLRYLEFKTVAGKNAFGSWFHTYMIISVGFHRHRPLSTPIICQTPGMSLATMMGHDGHDRPLNVQERLTCPKTKSRRVEAKVKGLPIVARAPTGSFPTGEHSTEGPLSLEWVFERKVQASQHVFYNICTFFVIRLPLVKI
jgi:hypothetical protein